VPLQPSSGEATPRTPRCAVEPGLIAKDAIVSGPPQPHKGRRWLASAALGLACCLGVTGCAQFDKALGHQEADVYFQTSTPVAFKLKVRAACDNLPHVKAIPIATGVPLSSAVDVVSYNTTGAGVADIARLEECVDKFQPRVQGVNVTDASDDS
jgi:hypothetical protein